MGKNFINNLYFRLGSPIAYGGMVYILILLINDRITELASNFELFEVLFSMLLTFINFECFRLLIVLLDSKLTFKLQLQWRVVIQFLVGSIIAIGFTYLFVAIYFVYLVGFNTFNTEAILFCSIFLVSSLFYNSLYFSLYFLNKRNEAVLQRENDLKKSVEYRLQSFKNEVNPTLLYQSLETLISLIYEDIPKADAFVNRLADYYRYALDNRQDELTTLAKEIAAGENLIALLNFDNVFITVTDQTEQEFQDFEIIPGTITQLIYHLVRNSIISATHPLNIFLITEGESVLGIKCTLNEKLQKIPNPLREIKDLQQAYSFYTEEPIVRVKAYQEVTIQVPLLQFELEEIE